jgi:molybdopterin converting factor small subunit
MGLEFDPKVDLGKLADLGALQGPKAKKKKTQQPIDFAAANANSRQAAKNDDNKLLKQAMATGKATMDDIAKKLAQVKDDPAAQMARRILNAKNHVAAYGEEMKKLNQKYEAIEKVKKTVKASNGMTYNQITAKLNDILNRGGWGVTRDDRTGKNRFPNLSEVYNTLKYYASMGDERAKAQLEELDQLIAANRELEEKHPELKTKYTAMITNNPDGTTTTTFLQGGSSSRIDM